MSTLKANVIDSSTGTSITIPTTKVLTITDAGGISMAGTAITATGAELNILDGVTSTTAELNILDGVTSTATEINVLDGIPAGLTAAEIGYSDGVTSAIQTQINTKGVGDALLAGDQTWTGSQRGTLVTDNDGSFDLDGGNNFFCTPAGNITLTFTNHTSGQSGYILFVNSGHTISLAATTKGDANLATTLTTAGTYLVSYLDNGTNAYLTTSAVFA